MKCVWLIGALLTLTLGNAQAQTPVQQQDRSISEILVQLRDNLQSSVATLPDVFCDEHLDSHENRNGKIKDEITLDSVIKARRQIGKAAEFAEDRDIHLRNGKPFENGRKVSLPFSIAGGFGSDFGSYFSPSFEACNQYRVISGATGNGNPLVLEVLRNGPAMGSKTCEGLNRESVATFQLDRDSLRIQWFQMSIPNAHLPNGFGDVKNTIEYRMVPLGERTYLLPAKVHAIASKPQDNDQLVYDAAYTNCHRYGSSATILPGMQVVPEEPR